MTVEELINKLQAIKNKKRIVLISSDGEGNDFSKFDSFSENNYRFDGREYEIGEEILTEELIKEGYSEEDVINGDPCLVLWP